MNPESPGQTIDHYELLEQIGEGSFGIVFRARQLEPIQRLVALKILKPGMDSRQILARFQEEHRALAMMDHSNVTVVFDAGTTGSGRPYFVMELVEGEPITEYCDARRLNLPQRLRIFATVCDGVQHAHRKGIVHRDLKPQNVLVVPDTGLGQVKVVDFGVARMLQRDPQTAAVRSAPNSWAGTPLYMSPEQAAGDDDRVDSRSDVYALGALLYELLTGTTPRAKDHEPPAAAAASFLTADAPVRPSLRPARLPGDRVATAAAARNTDPRHWAKQLQGELDWIVMKSLDPDPSRRYETARGLRDDIERYLQGARVEACPVSRLYLLRKRLQRSCAAWLVRASWVAAVVLCAVTGLLLWRVIELRYRVVKMHDLQHRADASWRESDRTGQIQLHQDLLKLQRHLLGDRDPATLWTEVQLSRACLEQQQLRAAVAWGVHAYALLRETQGMAGPHTKHGATHLLNCYVELVWESVNPDAQARVEPLRRVPELVVRSRALCEATERYGYYLPGHKELLAAHFAWYFALQGDPDGMHQELTRVEYTWGLNSHAPWYRAVLHQTQQQPQVARQYLAAAHDLTSRWFCTTANNTHEDPFLTALNLRVCRYLGSARPWQLSDPIPPDLPRTYTELLALQPDDAALRFGRGVNWARQNNWRAAGDDFAAATAERPDVFECWEALAIARLQDGAEDDYRRACQQALQRFSLAAQSESRLLCLCLVTPDAAIPRSTLTQHVQQLSPVTPHDQLALAWSYYRLGDFAKALEHAPQRGEPLSACLGPLIKAMAHQRLGQTDAARRQSEQAAQQIHALLPSADGPPIAGMELPERPICWALVRQLQNEARGLIGVTRSD